MGDVVSDSSSRCFGKRWLNSSKRNTPWSWAHFRRSDLPTHFDVADGWTILDMYQEGVLAATDPSESSSRCKFVEAPR